MFQDEDFELGDEVAAGASCKVLKGSIDLDGETIALAVKDFVYDPGVEDEGEEAGGGEITRNLPLLVLSRKQSAVACDEGGYSERWLVTTGSMRNTLMSGAAVDAAAEASALQTRAA